MKSELIIVSGCNAAGKSTFIRSRINQFEDYQIIMPDVFRENTYPLMNTFAPLEKTSADMKSLS